VAVPDRLAPRRRQQRLLAPGRSNQRIAHDLVVALDTVKTHVTHVLGKLGAANRTEAAARARQLGLVPSHPRAGPVTPSGDGSPRRDIPPGRHLRVTPHGGRNSYRSQKSRTTHLPMEDVMYDPPGYLWAITIAGTAAIAAATCAVLYSGAKRAGLSRRRAALLAGGAAVVLGGWFTASAVIAGHGWYHTRLGHGVPWMPIAVAGFFGTLLALRRIPVVARALAAPGLASRLEYPHTFRVEGVAFLIIMALGHLPALFALPAGLGDIAAGIAAPLVAYRLARGTGRRAALWHNAFGMTDLVVALTLGALTGFQLLNITPSAAPIFELPLALIVTVGVPLLLALHITSMSTLARAPRTPLPTTGPLFAGATPRTAVAETPAAGAR
jgi:DNA-binding CsgD family transcriptional regulator